MKQIGNLAIVCAQRKDVIMILDRGKVAVVAGNATDSETRHVSWDDDNAIAEIIHALNFGEMSEKGNVK